MGRTRDLPRRRLALAAALVAGAALLPAGLARPLPWRVVDESPVPAAVNGSPAGPQNRPPAVDAGPLLTVAPGISVEIEGRVTDDGLGLPPGRLDVGWRLVSGPAEPVIDRPDRPLTTAAFPVIGQYVLALHATDGLQPAIDHVVVNVVAAGDLHRFLRIMPLGDSITAGHLEHHDTYRLALWRHLRDAGCLFDVVGSQTGTEHGPLSDPSADPHHEARSGWRADELGADVAGWARAQQPNVVLVHAGTNDAAIGRGADLVAGNLRRMVADLRSVDPEVTVLVAEIIPASWDSAGRIAGINAAVRALAAELDRAASPVVAVDMHTGFDVALHTTDGTHPNAAGEALMADRWWAVLQPLLAGSCDAT